MSKVFSTLDGILRGVLSKKSETEKKPFSSLDGWKGPVDLPSLDDVRELYMKYSFESKVEPEVFLTAVAKRLPSYRTTSTLKLDDHQYCSMIFSEDYGSFLLLFGTRAPKTVLLYHMGVGIDGALDSDGQEIDVKRYCSRFAMTFDLQLQELVFGLSTFDFSGKSI